MTEALSRFEEHLKTVPKRLVDISEAAAAAKPDPAQWSKKELLGHLIDSASNNHQRFVRAQQNNPYDGQRYEQDFWVASQAYATESWPDLVNLWLLYNRHLLHVLTVMPKEVYPHICRIGDYPQMTLGELAIDYVVHMEHHLEEMFAAPSEPQT
ncbi:MAG: DinB family protein [Candidatus Solibacter sp.]